MGWKIEGRRHRRKGERMERERRGHEARVATIGPEEGQSGGGCSPTDGDARKTALPPWWHRAIMRDERVETQSSGRSESSESATTALRRRTFGRPLCTHPTTADRDGEPLWRGGGDTQGFLLERPGRTQTHRRRRRRHGTRARSHGACRPSWRARTAGARADIRRSSRGAADR